MQHEICLTVEDLLQGCFSH